MKDNLARLRESVTKEPLCALFACHFVVKYQPVRPNLYRVFFIQSILSVNIIAMTYKRVFINISALLGDLFRRLLSGRWSVTRLMAPKWFRVDWTAA